MKRIPFSKSVFVNCPFDDEYEATLQAILFCIIFLGYTPRLAKERMDSGEFRLDKIREFIEASQYSIHDLSRCQASEKGELFRLNMPLELGLDYGCKKYFGGKRSNKKILILEKEPYRYQAAISDLAGFDISHHNGEYEIAMKNVRAWIVSSAKISAPPAPTKIINSYYDFQEWNFETLLKEGYSEKDIYELPTSQLLECMSSWIDAGKPV